MEVLRHNRRAALLIAAGLAVALVAVLLMLRGSHSPKNDDDSVIGTTPPGTSGSVPLPKATKKAEPRTKTSGAPAADVVASGAGVKMSAVGLGMGGLPGGTLEKSLPEMHIHLSLTSDHPIGWLGWIIPTSKDNSSGKRTGVGTSWSLSTIGYGRPDYARLFFMSGPVGSVTCTITVNGRVTEQRTTKGPYDQMMCQG